jgi:hypothetical protein
MAEIKSKQFSQIEAERERFSNFVVDLRRRETAAVRTLKSEEKAWGRKIKEPVSAAAAAVWNVWRNLLAGRQRILPRLAVHRPNFLAGTEQRLGPIRFKPAALLKIFKKKITYRRAAPRPWLALVRERENVFRVRGGQTYDSGRGRFRRHPWLAFVLVLLAIILPFQLAFYWPLGNLSKFAGQITKRSELALNNLMAAAGSAAQRDFKNADFEFQAAGANFLAAQDELGRINDSLLSLAARSDDPQVKLAAESKKFLLAGAAASALGRNLVLATDSLFNGDKNDFSGSLDNFLSYGRQAVADARSLKKSLADVNPANLPESYRAKFVSLSGQTGLLADSLSGLVTTGEQLKEVLGLSRDKRYLVVFQNNAELRASGGFLGSYALLDLRDGQIRNLEVPGGGAYDTAAGLKVRVAAPEPLWLVSTLWHFWDANWWPDWPTTAQNLMWFYEKSDGPSVDGVISVTPTVMEDLLEVTGPIDLTAEYGLTVDADNFWEKVQAVTEQLSLAKINPATVAGLPTSSPAVKTALPLQQNLAANPDNKPKKIIGDLLVKILEILPQKLTPENLVKIMAIFEDNIAGKQILLYFKDPALQAAVSERNWAGAVRETDQDYLLVVNTNIAGQKTDRVIRETIKHWSEVAPDGTITNTVEIVRAHQGVKGTALTGVRNVDWLRVYVPAGSELLSADGWRAPAAEYRQGRPDATVSASPFLAAENAAAPDPASGTKIYTENGKTVFANWLMLDPGATATVTLKYRLPFNFFAPAKPDSWLKRLNDWLNPSAGELWPYSLLVQKQPGAGADDFTSRLVLPASWPVFWRHPEDLAGVSGWEISAPLSRDRYWSILVQTNQAD